MTRSGLRWPDSILWHTVLLVMGVVLALAAANVATILLRPPPSDAPLTAYEVSRLLRGQPIVKNSTNLQVMAASEPPAQGEAGDDLVRAAIARHLGRPPRDIRLSMRGPPARRSPPIMEIPRREYELYGEAQFNPSIFGSFTAAVRQPDGRWRIVSRLTRDPVQRWQSATILSILISVLLTLPFAWLFSKRLARPIRALAQAAERLGRHQEVEPVFVRGPAEVRQAATAFNDMQARLRRYVAERTSVIGAIAHDLRTPLSRLNFHLASVPEDVRTKAEAEIAEMEQMISVTLDFVQNETRLQPHEPIDLGLLVEGVVDDLTDLGHDARMIENHPVTIQGDIVLLKRLFANLIANAVIYGKRAAISLTVEDGHAVVDVADEGPGLEPDDLERVFEPFYRAEASRNRATGGMGLGLAIVQSAAKAHGGDVRLFNRPEGGLCARVRLPLAR